jgi:hypothetical protein
LQRIFRPRSNLADKIVIAKPKSFEERSELGQICVVKLGIKFPAVVVTFDNATERAYTGWPDRLYVIDRDGRVAYKQVAPRAFRRSAAGCRRDSAETDSRETLSEIRTGGRNMKFVGLILKGLLFVLLTAAVLLKAADAPTVTVKGYVLDSACAFTKGLSKPISKQCATSCANTGSPLVILADDGTIYWPIADTMPSSGQNPKLLPFAGGKVTATGKVYQRGGSKAIVIEKIEAQPAQK